MFRIQGVCEHTHKWAVQLCSHIVSGLNNCSGSEESESDSSLDEDTLKYIVNKLKAKKKKKKKKLKEKKKPKKGKEAELKDISPLLEKTDLRRMLKGKID